MKDIKASIIIPVYNVEPLLRRCLDSVLSQDYKNIEIIIVNDGSTDNSLAICNEYKAKDSRIILINKENGGLSSARNAGIEKASGDILLFVDSDDWINSNLCSSIVPIFNHKEIDIVIFGFTIIQGNRIKRISNPHSKHISKEEAMEGLLIDKSIRNYAWNKAYKTELFKNVRYPEGKTFEDVATTFKLFDNASSFYTLDKCLYNYEIRLNSISTKWWKSEKKVSDYFYVKQMQYFYIKNNYPALIQKASTSVGFAALMGISYLINQDNTEIIDFLQKEKDYLLHSSFPFSILISLYYKNQRLVVKLMRQFFR